MKVDLEPLEIRFMQNSISRYFKDGHSVDETIDSIIEGRLSPSVLLPIKVVLINGEYYSCNNRRLYVFRVLQCEGYLAYCNNLIRVNVIRSRGGRRITTTNDGTSIRIRNGGQVRPHTEEDHIPLTRNNIARGGILSSNSWLSDFDDELRRIRYDYNSSCSY